MDNEISREEYKYAKVFNANENKGGIKDLTYFPPDYIIRFIEGDYWGKQYRMIDLGRKFNIGKGDVEFSINDESLSDIHCSISYIDNSIYYCLEDHKSLSGTWKFIHNLDLCYEITDFPKYFRFFEYEFYIDMTENSHYLKFTTSIKKDNESTYFIERKIENGETISVGKDSCVINLITKNNENCKFEIMKLANRVFILNRTEEIVNDGIFYKLSEGECALIRPGDIIILGELKIKILNNNWGIFSDIGTKLKQEDRYVIIDDLRLFDFIVLPYYAIYDGHGGIECSSYLSKKLHNNIKEIVALKNLEESKNFLNDFIEVIQEAIIFTDISYNKDDKFSPNKGSTCNIVFLIANKLLCCNLGDSVAILHCSDSTKVFLSKDFKPLRQCETERIKLKNGIISGNNGRLMGVISISRGFGDWRFKDPKNPENVKKMEDVPKNYDDYLISNRAEFRIFEIDLVNYDYFIIASDGIFDESIKYKRVFDVINNSMTSDKKNSDGNELLNVQFISENVRLDILNKYSQKLDNITLLIVSLKNN